MGASDYMVGNAPGGVSYAAPLVGFQLGQQIADLPQKYFEGTQNKRTLELQSAFKEGLPRDANGQLDINAMADRLVKLGGVDAAQNVLPLLIQQQTGNINADIARGNVPGSNTGSFTSQPAPVPASPVQSSATPTQRTNVATGSNTLIGIATDAVGEQNAGLVATRAAQSLGIDPNQPLTETQANQVRQVIPRVAQALTAQQQAPTPAAAPVAQPIQPPTAESPAAALVPPQFKANPRAFADFLLARAAQIGKFDPQGASALEKRAQPVLDALLKAGELTSEQKNAAGSGARSPLDYEAQKSVQAANIKHSESLEGGLQSLGNSSATMLDNVSLQKATTNHPDFYSGPADKAALFLKRAVPSLAGSAAPMELYGKVLNANMLHMIDNMKAASQEMGAGTSRIFTAQIDQIEKASGTLDNSPTGLRALAELNERTLKRNIQIADMAAAYKQGQLRDLPPEFSKYGPDKLPGTLGPNFERGLRDWMSRNPLLSSEELAEPKVLGAPTFRTPQAALAAKLPKGTPIRTPDGKIMYAP